MWEETGIYKYRWTIDLRASSDFWVSVSMV